MSEPTDNIQKREHGRWRTKTYGKQIVEYANQSIAPQEQGVYNALWDGLIEEHKFEKPEELMLLDSVIYDFIRIKRLQSWIMKNGDIVKFKLRGGREIAKASDASYLLNAVETQLRGNMKELLLTRKEMTKKKIGMGTKDFASFLEDIKTVDAEVVDDEKDKKSV
jgi:hypothetical protein